MLKYLFFLSFISLLWGCSKTADAGFASPLGAGGSLARFTLVGNYLYTVDKRLLKVFDISNPAQPTLKKTVEAGFEIETIFPFKDKLFLGSTTVVYVFDLSDPANPKKVSELSSPTAPRRCDPVVAKDTVAYATLRSNGPCGGTQSILAAYDIKDITKPIQKGFAFVTEPYGLAYADSTLYVCDKSMGLIVFSIAEAYKPVIKKIITRTGQYFIDVIPYGNTLICWVNNGLLLYDITDKQNPLLINQIL